MKLTIDVTREHFSRLADMATQDDLRLEEWVQERLREIAYRAMSRVELRIAAEEQVRELHAQGMNDYQIAAVVDYSASGVRAVRHRLGLGLQPTNVNHGTKGAYNAHGCRCDLCRQANTDYYRELRRKKRNSG